MLPLNKISKIVIHHSHNDNHTLESIKKLHVEKNCWEGIGYHWIIFQDGKLQPARSEKFQGAHVKGHNEDSIGICLNGNLDEHPPTSEQMKTLIQFLKQKNISPENILGHNELSGTSTTCPGKFMNMNEIRKILK